MTEQKQNTEDINEILNEFYKLKDKYGKTYYEKYVKKIVQATNKSNKEKKREFSSLPKPECINCQRNVGTLFSITNDQNEFRRQFVIKCGDIAEPCPLDIQFFYGTRISYEDEIKEQTKTLDKIKDEIVIEKNNAIFGYISPALASIVFSKSQYDLKDIMSMTGYIIEKNILVNHNPAKKELLHKLQDELQREYLESYKGFMQRFVQENNVDFCKDAVQVYVNEIVPKLKEIQRLKYAINNVEYDAGAHTFHLFQRPNSLENSQYVMGDDQVISFVKGVAFKKSSKGTRKTSTEKKPKNKTIKLKPTIEIVEDVEEENVEEQQ